MEEKKKIYSIFIPVGLIEDLRRISKKTGISRQTLSSIETMKSRMSWNTFLALVLFFSINEQTDQMLLSYKGFLENLTSILKCEVD